MDNAPELLPDSAPMAKVWPFHEVFQQASDRLNFQHSIDMYGHVPIIRCLDYSPQTKQTQGGGDRRIFFSMDFGTDVLLMPSLAEYSRGVGENCQ